jgi:hypothetical protein
MYPMFKDTRLHFFEFETRIGMECKPVPVFSVYPKVSDEKTFGGACQIENSDHFVHL